MATSKLYDVVLFGATGFTGNLIVEYLVKNYDVNSSLKWAIAGRSLQKLESVRSKVAKTHPNASNIPLIEADSGDRGSLVRMVRQTKAVITTVGPYGRYGEGLVAACAENGVHYADLTGEPWFVYEMTEKYQERAKQTGARIVHCCGFDSIPSDLGTLVVADYIKKKFNTPVGPVVAHFEAQGGMSGGTLDSIISLFEQPWSKFLKSLKVSSNPHSLVPEKKGAGHDQVIPWFDKDIKKWTAPFLMQAINAKVARKSGAILNYGDNFSYAETMVTGRGLIGLIGAFIVATALAFGPVMLIFAPIRWLLTRLLPPGSGPSPEVMKNGWARAVVVGKPERVRGGSSAPTVFGLVEMHGDPGYSQTAVMLAESGICLARESSSSIPGGFHTPATAMGLKLVERLKKAGHRYEVSEGQAPLPTTGNKKQQ